MNIAIIGGTGRMGKWMARFLKEEGASITIIGRNPVTVRETGLEIGCHATTDLNAASQAQAVIISVAIDSFEEVVKNLVPCTTKNQYIFDVTSVKTMPVEIMNRYITRGVSLGTHPVFGPGARGITGHNFVLTPTNTAQQELAGAAEAFLTRHGAKVSIMSPDEHDSLMAIILGLAHFISIVSANALVDYGKLEKMSEVQGVTYRALLTLIESVLSEDPELYASLQMNLPHLKEAQEIFIHNARLWTEIVEDKDRQSFIERMRHLRQRFEENNPDFGRAYDNMYRLINP
ncbi:MAG: prephenate dehydrogenase [Dehalococcoidales bacterium]|nr:prephenate dehydrogenase [Dehalococcoidales bacterium]MDD4465129.1 prephenate dehydrogenase [Dehalococcoidales bacterium]